MAGTKIPPAVKLELDRYLKAVREALRQRHGKAFNNPGNVPATGSDALLKRSGAGIRGIRVITKLRNRRDLNTLRGELGIPFPLSVHEEGATIRAKKSQFLTIPLSAALDSRGIPLRPSARAWENTFVQKSTRGNLLIFQKRGTEIVPLYLLKREVQLPPRLKAQETLNAGLNFFVDEAMGAAVKAITKVL